MLRYPGTETEVCIGDHVRGRILHLIPFAGRIHYLPGVSPLNRIAGFDGTDQVIIAAKTKYVFVVARTDIGEIAGRIRFVKRDDDGYVGLSPDEKIGYSDDTSTTDASIPVDEQEIEPAPSRFAVDPDKAEAWTGRLFLASIIALLAFLYFSHR